MPVDISDATVRARLMRRSMTMFRDWTRDQVVLILGPVLLSVALVALYVAGVLPVSAPALLFLVVLINLGADIALAVNSERSVKRGRVRLRNDLVGSPAVALERFAAAGGLYRGTVMLAGGRWWAASDQRIRAGQPLRVTGRRGLVLYVVPDAA